ncbi:HAD-IIIA family hydrolase [Cyanobium sp. Alchichica 3B3-8F6]|uniref:HAD-IIIA family hydrolase n=1 Tax=Cyanobium sp. Alchichica 3B3-8F6 TaxID=2823696 RepID=UPI0020CF6CF2|nr:HAD-IIIA family hydrolase [Cyanobium sp. Alchichica 3B3-8F6]MCP9882387.1 HAD-IIIA family hydrolase [Cyanobium sp. Alchichica 3B3-8F6]
MAEYVYTSLDNASVITSKYMDIARSSILFLDRDGIIIKDVGHISKIEDVELVPGIDRLILRLKDAGMLIVVVTNQASVPRGIISVDKYIELTTHMLCLLGESTPDMILSSFYHPIFSKTNCNSSWRKPGSGMFRYALDILDVDINKCIMIGDRPSDVLAAEAVGISTNYLLKTERYADEICLYKVNNKIRGKGFKLINSLDNVG